MGKKKLKQQIKELEKIILHHDKVQENKIKREKKENKINYDDLGYCTECGSQTSNTLNAMCGHSYVCSECVDEVWSNDGYYDSDGIFQHTHTSYTSN